MIRTLICRIVCLGALVGQLGGETIDGLCLNLGKEEFKVREEASEALYERAVTDRKIIVEKVAQVRKTTENPEIQLRTGELLRRIYLRYELGIGGSDFGLSLGWYIDHDGKDVSSYPLVLDVAVDSPADKAGLNPGDVITKLNGESTRGHESRNVLVRKLATVKAGTETKFSKRFSGLEEPLKIYNKNKKAEVVVVPIVASEDEAVEVVAEDFERWLSSFGE